jgi:hypothetical protein
VLTDWPEGRELARRKRLLLQQELGSLLQIVPPVGQNILGAQVRGVN